MKYGNFISQASLYPLFGDDLFSTFGGTLASRRLQFSRWVRSGKVIRLKRGVYTLPEPFRKVSFSLRWLANALYSPSYLSLEYMLSWYDMIPERVSEITSVTIHKTARFENPLGRFVYRSLKKELFFGFEEREDECQKKILAATPEKALLDFIYLYSHWKSTEDFLEKNIRLQQLNQLNKKRLRVFADRFSSKKMDEAKKCLERMMK